MARRRTSSAAWTAASVLLVVLGLVAARRRARELADERAGRLAPLGPDGGTEVPPAVRGVAARVCTWAPPPLERGRRRMGLAWASPVTLVGLAMAVLGGGRPTWDDRIGAFVATGVSGPSGWALRQAGLGANTMGHAIVVRGDRASDRLLAHEAVHVRQFERLGVLMYPLYLWYAARYGYRENPLEIAARRAGPLTSRS
ncbi:hypothetical protein [Salsipaludibacter albus]|uniref:hypothetical protein n=1 Tax=Salsipaludibacter albus TaxID=2849650 RepID=UPI001EE49596|nr:hypothetical protein [Salsipaludibacter albus]MBY5163206.1 hypothetical protein [Salsipaludibacter albus]